MAEGLCCGLGKCRRNRYKRERRSRWLEFETRESIQGANTHPNKQCHNNRNGPLCYRSARRTRSHSFIFRLSRSEAIRRSRDTPSVQHALRPRYCFHVIVAWPYNTLHMRLPTPKPPAQAPGTASFVPPGCAPPSPSATPSSTMDKPTTLSLYLPTSAIRQTKTYM